MLSCKTLILGPIFCVFVAIASLGFLQCFSPSEKLKIDEDGWWSDKEKPKDYPNYLSFKPKEFEIKFEDYMVKDLKERLNNARFSKPLIDANFHYGTNIDHLKSILLYWQNVYDFKKYEKELNKFNHFKVEIEGINVHFLRAKTKSAKSGEFLPTDLIFELNYVLLDLY